MISFILTWFYRLTPSEQPEAQASQSNSPRQSASPSSYPAPDEKNELAGVDTILTDCHNFFVRTFMQTEAFGTAGDSNCKSAEIS